MKLKKWHVAAIGSFLCIAAAGALYWFMMKPRQEELAAVTASYEQLDNEGSESNRQAAERRLLKAQNDLNNNTHKLDVYMNKYMPNLQFEKRDKGMIALWNEQIYNLVPTVERFSRDPNPNVKVITGTFTAPPPPANPNDPLFSQEWIRYDMGPYAVRGDFKALMKNIRRWKDCNRLIVISPPILAGTSPNLVSSYNLTCYVAPRSVGGAPLPMAGTVGGDQPQ
ncbi:MAG: hypothetical protein J6X38_04215 [Abditibacteriota bacterium]|nr:hypothetical protein [Abditibacteriota bacterium]